MNEFKTEEELYQKLRPAFLVKLRILSNKQMNYITMNDIWNFLKERIWSKTYNLTLGEIVNDIINCDNFDVDDYLKSKLYNNERNLYFK